MPEGPIGFMSYVQRDDLHDEGSITRLRQRLAAEVRMQTGRDFPIFQDIDDIFIGERWRQRIDGSIDGSTLLIAIITPAFLLSSNCREELRKFFDRERQLGRDDLTLPILYVDTPGLAESSDSLAVELSARQYFDWRHLRLADPEGLEVRRGIAELAGQVVSALQRSRRESTIDVSIAPELVAPEPNGGLGFLELIAEAEEAMPQFNATIQAFAEQTALLAELANNATAAMNRAATQGRPAAGRLVAVRQFASALEEPAETMEELAADYVDQLSRVDGGIQALIARIPEIDGEEDIEAAQDLREVLTALANGAQEGLDSVGTMVDSLREPSQLSSSLRPVLRRISDAATRLQESRDTFVAWRDNLSDALATSGHS